MQRGKRKIHEAKSYWSVSQQYYATYYNLFCSTGLMVIKQYSQKIGKTIGCINRVTLELYNSTIEKLKGVHNTKCFNSRRLFNTYHCK